jgi:hypothetical protein
VSLQFQRVGRERGSYLPATDLHGATAGLVPAGRVEMWVAARRAPGAKGAIVRVALSTSEFAVGTREGVMDVVLPAPAGY